MSTFTKVSYLNANPKGTGDNRLKSIPAKASHLNDLIDTLTTASSVTATADGTGTGVIPEGTHFATVTSANAVHWVVLPSPVVGTILYLNVTANGCELRSSAPATVLINAGTGGAAVESAIGANVLVRCICVSATAWNCQKFVAAGTPTALEAAS